MMLQVGNTFLTVIDLKRYQRINVYTPDNADLLYVRHILGISAEYAPGGLPRMVSATKLSPDITKRLTGTEDTTALATNPVGTNPAVRPAPSLEAHEPGTERVPSTKWRSGPETDAELTVRLMMPRQKTILWCYDRQTGEPIRWLESPRAGMTVDATVGPTPISCDVISVRGEPNSVGVYYQVQTDVSPCPNGSDRFVLSHRWTMQHTYDEDYYLTRVTSGEIVFHAGVRDAIGLNPDLVRNQFILPIPPGFRRRILDISEASDGCTIRYTIADTDPTVAFSPGDSGATQISIIESSQYSAPLGGEGPHAGQSLGGSIFRPIGKLMDRITGGNFDAGWNMLFGG